MQINTVNLRIYESTRDKLKARCQKLSVKYKTKYTYDRLLNELLSK